MSFSTQPDEEPLRLIINDVLKSTQNALTIAGKVESGFCENGARLFLMPDANSVIVKSLCGIRSDRIKLMCFSDICVDGPNGTQTIGISPRVQSPNASQVCFAGDQVIVNLGGAFEPDSVYPGKLLCRGGTVCQKKDSPLPPVCLSTTRIDLGAHHSDATLSRQNHRFRHSNANSERNKSRTVCSFASHSMRDHSASKFTEQKHKRVE